MTQPSKPRASWASRQMLTLSAHNCRTNMDKLDPIWKVLGKAALAAAPSMRNTAPNHITGAVWQLESKSIFATLKIAKQK